MRQMEIDPVSRPFLNKIQSSSFYRFFENCQVQKVSTAKNKNYALHKYDTLSPEKLQAIKKEISIFSRMHKLFLPFVSMKSYSISDDNSVELFTKCYKSDLGGQDSSIYGSSESGYNFLTESVHDQTPDTKNEPNDFFTDSTKIIYGLAYAIKILNDRGIIHRQINPSHICLNDQGEPLLIDFGIYRKIKYHKLPQKSYNAFMAPEVVNNLNHCPKADVFSFGMILIYILSNNEIKYNGINVVPLPAASVFDRIVNKKQVPLIPDDCGDEVQELIKNCIQIDPENRWSISDVFEFLENKDFHLPDSDLDACHAYLGKIKDAMTKLDIPDELI